MKSNFETALRLVLVHEGGFSNHKDDPGGRTMRGVTQRTYDAYRQRLDMPTADVRNIHEDELRDIYRTQYWDKVQADDMPSGLDYAVFDFAVNSGPSRAAKFLQRIVGAEQDGVIGSQTIAALRGRDTASMIVRLCDDRLAWLKRLKTFAKFGRGWSRRVAEVKEDALEMTRVKSPAPRAPIPDADRTPKTPANPPRTATAAARDNADTLTAGGVLTGLLGGATQTEGAVQILLVAGVLAVVGFILWKNLKAEA